MPKVVIDGIEYVPRAEVPPLTDERLQNALEELAPELAELAAQNPRAAYERIHGPGD